MRQLAGRLRATDYPAALEVARAQGVALAALLPAALRASPAQVEARARTMAKPWVRAFVTHDPGPALDALAALPVPVLAVLGGRDTQVPLAQNEPVLRQRLAGHPNPMVRVFPALNHLLQPAATGRAEEYVSIATTMSDDVLRLVAEWAAPLQR
jgi:fermentation-respiration switch protein FrsA (DUF1100 family)